MTISFKFESSSPGPVRDKVPWRNDYGGSVNIIVSVVAKRPGPVTE